MQGALKKDEWSVRRLERREFSLARELVTRHHYAKGASHTASAYYGLFNNESGEMCGAALWLVPSPQVGKRLLGDDWRRCLGLSRLVVLPHVPKNGASFLLGACMRDIKREGRWRTLVTFADESQEHTGAIYRATNWRYDGRTQAIARYLKPDGSQVSTKRANKTRRKAEMLALGYTYAGRFRKLRFVYEVK